MCPEYGKVVAKVDLKSAMDRTLHLNDGLPRNGDILGWRLADDGSRGSGRFQLSTEARRIETAVGSGPAEHRIDARW